ncbi:MAG TPA: ECF transporter S component [Clostridia bacterium]|jgi:thiamine transporter ThiT
MSRTLRLCYAALFMAMGMFLPFLTGQIPQIGNMLLPMHFGVLLCGLICGPFYGLAVGFLTPLLRSVTFQMPPLMPNAAAMAFELAAYGFVIGLIYFKFKGNKIALYVSLIAAMIAGRIVWGLASIVFYGFADKTFTWAIFFAGAFVKAIPGIVLQIVIIPILVIIYEKYFEPRLVKKPQ